MCYVRSESIYLAMSVLCHDGEVPDLNQRSTVYGQVEVDACS